MFYYALHHALPETERFTEGRRNCATFLFGSFLYGFVYVLVKNLRLRAGECMDSVLSAMAMLWGADVAAMGYIYKSYYGRSLVNELAIVDDDVGHEGRPGWTYDVATHTYRRLTPADMVAKATAEIAKRDRAAKADAAKAETSTRVAAIDARKREIRAAKVIQRWWRDVLYSPPDGIFYLRAKQQFEEESVNA